MTAPATSLSTSPALPLRAALPALAAGLIYAVLLMAGDQLLRDPDTFWQITVGNWIIDHRAVPQTDIYSWTMQGAPWISTQWLAQTAFAVAFRSLGWAGPVVLSAAAMALAFALLTRFLGRWLAPIPTAALASAAFALTVPHLVARPHVLALPVMVAFVGGLIAAWDRRTAPSLLLLPLMALWANLHGGFVLGLALVAPISVGTVLASPPSQQPTILMRWAMFGVLAVGAACLTPYGWDSLLASRRILNLGQALALIGEWRPANFGHAGPLEITVLGGLAFALWRGFRLSPVRIILVVGFVFMALSHIRNAEVLALLAPLVLARPIAMQSGGERLTPVALSKGIAAALVGLMLTGTAAVLATHRYAPDLHQSPVAAAQVVKERGLTRVLNDYDFGGYLISVGIPTYIDGRTELYGEAPMVSHDSFSGVKRPEDFFKLIADDRVQATLLRAQSAATTMLDHLDGWRRIHTDDVAVVHLRDPSAKALQQPVLRSSMN